MASSVHSAEASNEKAAGSELQSAGAYNPWRESLENCIDGSNYLRASEYLALIDELGAWYTQEAQIRALLWKEHPECCGNAVVGGEYYGQQEMICCGNPEPSLLNDAQIVVSLRAMFPEAA